MDIQITTRHNTKASTSLKDVITTKLNKAERYFEKITSCHVILDTEHDEKLVEIIINVRGKSVTAKAHSGTIGKSVDDAIDKIERQLKKLNEKVKEHKGVKPQPLVDEPQDEFDDEFEEEYEESYEIE